jgi:hypothetical protein
MSERITRVQTLTSLTDPPLRRVITPKVSPLHFLFFFSKLPRQDIDIGSYLPPIFGLFGTRD